jgi:rSAM/selenodomain-associated transferase 2
MHGALTAKHNDEAPIAEKDLLQPFASIIIPTLNEAANVERVSDSLIGLHNTEIIFADGGSTDRTIERIEELRLHHANVRLVHSAKSRSKQMNAGASEARGEWLFFLHADTILPATSFHQFVQQVRATPSLQSGAFEFRVDNKRFVYRYLEFYVRLRAKYGKLPFGDQAIFLKRNLFERLGGYRDDYPLMEDMELVQRLNKLDGFEVLDIPVFTSARRFEADGYLKRTCGNLYLQLQYKMGAHPKELARLYYR